MKNIIYNSLILGALLISTQYKAQHILEALEGGIIPSEKCLELVYDKYYGDGDHNFVYCAVMGPGNKKWLNLNLGAEYAREGSVYFNPEAVPTDDRDWKAFGSLYNYNRDSDGHELVQYRMGTSFWEVKHRNGYTPNRPNAGEKSNKVAYEYEYITEWEASNDPCPSGYRVMDFSYLLGTTGYTWVGGMDGTAIMKHNSYPNWSLVTAPNWIAFNWQHRTNIGMAAMLNDGYLLTRAIPAGEGAGTSAVWIRQHSTTKWVNRLGNWIVDDRSYVTRQPYAHVVFDRGVYGPWADSWSSEYGIVGGYGGAGAVRCVEK